MSWTMDTERNVSVTRRTNLLNLGAPLAGESKEADVGED